MNKTYVLITPARNEEDYIEKTIQSVISQTILPEKWIIISDGSTDLTDEIVEKYIKKYNYIFLKHIMGDNKRNFGSQARAFNIGYSQLKNMDFDFIGNLDADVSLDSNYYDSIIEKFQQNPRLGISGGLIFEEYNGEFKSRPTNSIRSVANAIQLFRRECYETIGGYTPLKYGGHDTLAEIIARKKGWHVEAFPEFKIYHHRHASGGILRRRFLDGMRGFSIGNHPLFEIFKCIRRVKERPYLIGAFSRLMGFIWPYCQGEKRMVSGELVKFLRREQMYRLKEFFSNVKKL